MRAILMIPPLALLAACAGRQTGTTTPTPEPEVRQLEPMRITATRTEGGELEMGAYDAEMLFQRANAKLDSGHCDQAIPLYDRVADEFPDSRFVSPSLYNAGLCFMEGDELADAAARFERLLRETPASSDVKHARFQLAHVYLGLERWPDALAQAETLLRQELTPDERVEAMARAAQAELGAGHEREAAERARSALAYARTRPEDDRVVQVYHLAAANFVYAETLRLRAEAVQLPEGGVAVQRPVLERRAQLILAAQTEYFDTMRHTHPEWAAAAGYRIGEMYDHFWEAITTAPVPPPSRQMTPEERQIYDEEYRLSLARLVKPLIRHSIRYWELTLLMVERTGVNTEWTERIQADLERARERLLDQPDGPEGIDAVDRSESGSAGDRGGDAPPARDAG
ncbi:MAG: tetratricopeptide repeat protein [Deltaproteobacteria bacterium]|nr:tetratricopeptide repeat protein [Deltaproteobacteria bacterium]